MNSEKIFSSERQKSLGLRFVPPDVDQLMRLQEQVNTIGQILSKTAPIVVPPEHGFLDIPLSKMQKEQIDLELGPPLAEAAVNLQKQLLAIPIAEGNERMVNLPRLFAESDVELSLSEIPFHPACGDWANKPRIYYVRESVAQHLLLAGRALGKIGLKIRLEDAFRPSGVQAGLFLRRVRLILEQHPDWIDNFDRVWTEARSKTAISARMAGHSAGAAVDITLRKLDGKPLPIGNNYLDGGPRVASFFPYLTQPEWDARTLFSVAMDLSGLKIYPFENWHASFGDLSAGISSGENFGVAVNYYARYGAIKGFDPETGEVEPYSADEMVKPFYHQEELLHELRIKKGNYD